MIHMLISYNWLRELTETETAPRVLAERLTMLGLAVDAVREVEDDFVLEFDLTSNRPDCLSHLGIAREVCALEGMRLHSLDTRATNVSRRASDLTSVDIADARLCPRYAARVVRGVKIAPSPEWLIKRLQAIGQRPINNVADITNYVMHETGQPLHAFDLETLTERRIIVRRALAGEKLKTLDGVEREFDSKMLVISDAARAVAIAGVMGGAETEITDATRDVLIESAYFDPASVRRTAWKLGMQTEASRRFERGVDYEGAIHAPKRAVALICQLAGGTATEDAIDVYPQPIKPPSVAVRPERIETLTGLDVPAREVTRILSNLGFKQREKDYQGETELTLRDGVGAMASMDTNSAMGFEVPSWRVDIEREEDLVEEVARFVGYEKIIPRLPQSNTVGEYQPTERRRRASRRALASLGYDEAINFSFIDEAHQSKFATVFDGEMRALSVPGDNDVDAQSSTEFIKLSNPVIYGVTLMRPTLVPGLLDAVRNNFNQGTRDVRLFELGLVFAPNNADAGGRPLERESLALVMTGGAMEEGRAIAPRELDFYDLKGALEAVADALQITPLEFAAASARHLREGQTARIEANGRIVGSIGRLTEEVAARYKFRQPVFVAEVDFGALLETDEQRALYVPLARFPSVRRDVSLLADRRGTLEEMRRIISDLGIEACRRVMFVDVYEGANMPEGKRSVTLRLEYRADDRTLRDEEVDEMHGRIVHALEELLGAQQRAV